MYLDHYLLHTASIQHTSSYRLRTAQISCRNSKLEPISQIRLFEAFIRATGMYLDHYLPHIPLIQHTSSYGLRTAQISCRNSNLEPISQIRLIKLFLRKSNRDVLGPLSATHSKHTTHLVVLTHDSPNWSQNSKLEPIS